MIGEKGGEHPFAIIFAIHVYFADTGLRKKLWDSFGDLGASQNSNASRLFRKRQARTTKYFGSHRLTLATFSFERAAPCSVGRGGPANNWPRGNESAPDGSKSAAAHAWFTTVSNVM